MGQGPVVEDAHLINCEMDRDQVKQIATANHDLRSVHRTAGLAAGQMNAFARLKDLVQLNYVPGPADPITQISPTAAASVKLPPLPYRFNWSVRCTRPRAMKLLGKRFPLQKSVQVARKSHKSPNWWNVRGC